MMKLALNDGFVFNMETNRLEAYEFISAQVNFAKQTAVITCKLAGKERTMNQEDFTVYRNAVEFQRNVAMDEAGLDFISTFHRAYKVRPTNQSAWTFLDGRAVMVNVYDTDFLVEAFNKITPMDDRRFYDSANEAYRWNDYVLADVNGNETTHVCVANRVSLNNEQKKAVELFEQALKACKDARLYMAVDSEEYDVKFLPLNKIEEWTTHDPDEGMEHINDVLTTVRLCPYGEVYYSGDGGIEAYLKD